MPMHPRANFWIERDGEVLLSTWRVRLLEAIAETGSISAAAARMNISYRRAWDRRVKNGWAKNWLKPKPEELAAVGPNLPQPPRITSDASGNSPPG